MAATVVFDLTQAIIIGVVFASIMFMVKISNMEVTIHEVDQAKLFEKSGVVFNRPSHHVRVVYFTGPIFFATVERLENQLSELDTTHVLILSMRGVPLIDISGIQALDELYHELKLKNCKLMLCGLQPQVLKMFERSGLTDKIGKDMIFWSADQAIIAAQDVIVA